MAASTTLRSWWSKDTVVAVTGSNKGLGYEIVRGLAKQGLTTVLTARDPARGLTALQTLQAEGLDSVHFHQLDVTDTDSVKRLAAWLKKEFGGFDILINNAAVQKFSQVYEDAQETLETNYFGAKTVTKELFPLLRSASPAGARIVMVSSQNGLLRRFENNYVKSKLRVDAQQLNEDIIDSVATKYLEDVKTGRANEEGWAPNWYQYSESKLFMNAYVRVLAGSLPNQPKDCPIFVNSICPGPMDTDMVGGYFKKMGGDRTQVQGLASAEEASKAVISLALLPRDGYPTGKFFADGHEIAF
ncbi:unnamed protein product [Sphagnum balticum]